MGITLLPPFYLRRVMSELVLEPPTFENGYQNFTNPYCMLSYYYQIFTDPYRMLLYQIRWAFGFIAKIAPWQCEHTKIYSKITLFGTENEFHDSQHQIFCKGGMDKAMSNPVSKVIDEWKQSDGTHSPLQCTHDQILQWSWSYGWKH